MAIAVPTEQKKGKDLVLCSVAVALILGAAIFKRCGRNGLVGKLLSFESNCSIIRLCLFMLIQKAFIRSQVR